VSNCGLLIVMETLNHHHWIQ